MGVHTAYLREGHVSQLAFTSNRDWEGIGRERIVIVRSTEFVSSLQAYGQTFKKWGKGTQRCLDDEVGDRKINDPISGVTKDGNEAR